MNPSLRSQLRDTLRARSETESWRALIAQHGTPLLVLDPYRVVEQCRLLKSHLRGFGLHYAVKTSPHPAVLRAVAASGCGFDVATSGGDRTPWRAWPSHRPLHQHQPGQEAHRHRPRLHGRCSHLRRRQSDRGPEVRGAARRHQHPCAARVPEPVGEVGSVRQVRCRPGRRRTCRQACIGHRGSIRGLQLSRRKPGNQPAGVRHCAARHTGACHPHQRNAWRRNRNHRYRRWLSGELPRGDAADRRDRRRLDQALGDRRDDSPCWQSPVGSLPPTA